MAPLKFIQEGDRNPRVREIASPQLQMSGMLDPSRHPVKLQGRDADHYLPVHAPFHPPGFPVCAPPSET